MRPLKPKAENIMRPREREKEKWWVPLKLVAEQENDLELEDLFIYLRQLD